VLIAGTSGVPSIAAGIGGAFAILGAAFLVKGLFIIHDAETHGSFTRENADGSHASSVPPAP
jgi:hypothetical protein